MDWHESDASDDGEGHESLSTSRKRSSRACDQCRKTKSKCERGAGEGAPCKSCALTGTACTFLGPSYKRGPPKGYIHAIEQRWHQVESLLGAILQCPDPRVRSVVADLRQDDLAREILARVDMGPYGPSGRRFQAQNSTKEDFFASVLRSNDTVNSNRDQSRTRRQSRLSREKVSSNQDRGLAVAPTQEWQDNLSKRLASSSSTSSPLYGSCSTSSQPGQPASQRRRLEASPVDWNDMYTLDPTSDSDEHDSLKDPTEGIGELSLTENQEIRFHGKASGLHLLSKDNRTDERNEGGIWMLPMARVWPPSKDHIAQVAQDYDLDVVLPPVALQDHLINLYFTYIHPVYPVIHKSRFLTEYEARKQGRTPEPPPAKFSSPKPESSQQADDLLLLSMFAITARFVDNIEPLPSNGNMWEAGIEYLNSARAILTKIFDRSRPSTVQSLLLLGYREFGVGSMEQGWIYIGMAIRMAIDLGLNTNSDRWKQHGHDLFARDETQTRRQIWWICCLADRYGSVYMGRPIIIREEDYDTPLPEITEYDEEPWQPLRSDSFDVAYTAVPGKIMLTFNATSTLFTIIGDIITHIYPVRSSQRMSRRSLYAELETRLDQWYLRLPEALQFDLNSKRRVPPPHVLFVHIRYWGAVLLLNRAFIPNWKGASSANSPSADFSSTSRKSTIALKAFDLAQTAASRISAIVNAWCETFTLKRASPFLSAYMLATGIMHILTLTLRPSNPQASQGLRQCMTALNEMGVLWPSAARALDLLSGVKLEYESTQPLVPSGDRIKRPADDAFGQEKSSDYLQRETFGVDGNHQRLSQQQQPSLADVQGVQDLGTRIMAHMLGLDVPGMGPSASYYPGYEWWPRPGEDKQPGLTPRGAPPMQHQVRQVQQRPVQPQQLPPFAHVAGDVGGYSRTSNLHGYPGSAIPESQRILGGEEWIQPTTQGTVQPDYSYNYQYGL
ncbi:hypothetical protein E1B28_001524 [Marasmius oreades]|uniref:Zn(2)-C6 fungal-type domain-containing protein n=1 Tax=Marasmius oreades TaxID=181124 RepID=A0A9P8AFI3_9AGAR|nr:uncharacterized protein E1B28_001524 [Marasmius oreades]KAG7099704.1 hypothetical protein E1B28_001524 [Marasmius oreades]